MKRLLCLISGMNTGGAETFLMKIYRSLDKTKYQMDFCINVPDKCFYEDEITTLGGRIYRIPSKSESAQEFSKQLYDVVSNNGYKYVLRVTSNAAGFMDLKIAKKAGAEICSVRSSNSSDGGGIKVKIAHKLGALLYRRYVDVKIAPSDLAAEYTFGKRAVENGEVVMLHNSVDLDTYRYDREAGERIRAELGADGSTVLFGHIGRFFTQKNHRFLIDIFNEIHKQNKNTKLLLIGKGELEDDIKKYVDLLGLTDAVIFGGLRSDIPAVLSAMDAFVFPSLYEGMPNTVIEAQATGLPCLIADTITREADITGLVKYMPLGDAALWAENALELVSDERKDTRDDFIKNGYDIQGSADKFVKAVFGE